MKKSIKILLLLIFISENIFVTKLFCENQILKNNFGFIVGSTTGFAYKRWLTQNNAIASHFSWSAEETGFFIIAIDYLMHNFEMAKVDSGQLPVFYGIGIKSQFKNKSHVSMRIPVGIDYIFDKAPFDVFIEFAPSLQFVDKTEFYFDGGLGVRYHF